MEGPRAWKCAKRNAITRRGISAPLSAHLLPKGFVRIRNFGFLASRHRSRLLPLGFKCLGSDPEALTNEAQPEETKGLWKCPKCGGPMIVVLRVNAPKWLPRPPPVSPVLEPESKPS